MTKKSTTKKTTKKASKKNWGFDIRNMDKKVRPQDDFFQYANGSWIKKTKIPKTEMQWGAFYILRDDNRKKVHDLLKGLGNDTRIKNGSDRQKLRDFYLSGMNERKINRLGLTPLSKYLDLIEGTTSREGLVDTITELQRIGVSVPWSLDVTLDEKNSQKNALYLYQSGTGLPDKEYYIGKSKNFVTIRGHYQKHIARMLKLSGLSAVKANIGAKKVLQIEKALARASMNAEEQRDVERMYNKMTVAQLQKHAPAVNWKEHMNGLSIPAVRTLIVSQPDFVKKANTMLTRTSLADWKLYLRWHLLSSYAGALSKDFVEENFAFYGKVLGGLQKMKPRWQRVYGTVSGSLGELLGREYVEKYFPEKSKRKIEEMASFVKKVYRKRLQKLEWMGEATKKRALKKLTTFTMKLGYPNKWKKYTALEITPESYVENIMASIAFHTAREYEKLTKPVDKNEWIVDAHIVNAFYWPNQNEIIFPAGILADPIFNPEHDPAVTFGALVSVIGHEMTHGFDDKGSLFDERGNMKNWWTKKDRERFMERAGLLVEQFNRYHAVDELNVNGRLTLGENIADLGGLIFGYYALQEYMKKHGRLPDIDGFTPEQRYFLGLAKLECGKWSDGFARISAISDSHAPPYTRTNGPMSNMDEFYEAFDVKEGDALWRPEEERVQIW